MTIYICIYLYCQVDERVWIRVKERSRKICLSAARARSLSFRGKGKKERLLQRRAGLVARVPWKRDRTMWNSLIDEATMRRRYLHRRVVLRQYVDSWILQFFFEEHLPLSSCSYKEWSFNVIPLFFFLVLKTSVSPALVRFPPVGSFIDRFHVWLTIATLTMVSYFLSFFFPLRPRCAISSVYLLPLSLGLDACASRWKLKHSSFFYVVKLFRNIALLKDLAASCLRWIHI